MSFETFATAVHARFSVMSEQELFTTVSGDALWDAYLASFPEGTDPIYKTHTELTCNCCRNFIRNIGPAVAIIDGKLTSVWGLPVWSLLNLETPYKEVAAALHAAVVSQPITDLFRPSEPTYGAQVSRKLLPNGAMHRFNHFWGRIARRHTSATPDKARGDYRAAAQLFERGLRELAPAAIQQVLELIDAGSLYRGAEHKAAVLTFQTAQHLYLTKTTDQERNILVWELAGSSVARFRNTVIGTLVQDLSEGVELERAVRSFEQKVAPTNYRRTTALITQSMTNAALKTLAALGLEDAVHRRFANIGDITINNVLWASSDAASKMKGGLADLLADSCKSVTVSSATEISIEDFLTTVAPSAKEISILFSNKHTGKLVSITAPQYADSGSLFTWPNNFAWSYNGNITDSITEKVKNAGGNINAKVRVSLAWHNYDDLDLWADTPAGKHIYFGSKQGILDVDMNAGGGITREPVENLSWNNLQDGDYTVGVNQYRQRETTNVGFSIQLAYSGDVFNWAFPYAHKGNTPVLRFTVSKGELVSFKAEPQMVPGMNSQDAWGLQTEKFIKVRTIMLSPNHWDGHSVGNKHYFFLLEGCRNPDPTRGMYNEFLSSALQPHRKVFEVLGSKLMCSYTDQQLSGLGFSSTKRDTATVEVVTATSKRQYAVTF